MVEKKQNRKGGAMSDTPTEVEIEESHFYQEAVKDRTFLLASIVESSDDAIITKTAKGVITSWNNGAERIYGYQAKEVLGQPPAMICRSDGAVELLRYGQMPLAIMDVQSFEEHHFSFEPGDKLVLYTDGISEARHGPDMLDIEGIERILADHSNLSASELAHTLLAAATEWANGRLTDDAAVVVVERQPVSKMACHLSLGTG